MKPGTKAFLRLHHGYRVPGHANRKLSNQRIGPFLIKRRVGNLAYELELPPTMKIHPVVSVAQLEPMPEDSNPYDRLRENEPGLVEDEGVEPDFYEIERLLDRRTNQTTSRAEYLVKWKGWGPAHNVWYDVRDLAAAKDLRKQYDELHPVTADENRGRRTKMRSRRNVRRDIEVEVNPQPNTPPVTTQQPRRLLMVQIPLSRALAPPINST